MAERATITTKTQIGAEATAGTGVAAGKWLPSLDGTSSLQGNMSDIRAGGVKFPTGSLLGQEWTTTKLDGVPSYDEITYMLSSILAKVSPSTSDTTAKTWTYAPSSSAEDTIQTYTIETGSSVRAQKSVYNFCSDFSLSGDRSNTKVSGTFVGKQFTDGITITNSPTTVGSQVLLMPNEVTIYSDSTSGGLGSTKLSRVLNWSIDISTVRSPLWVVDSSETSWSVPVEGAFDATLKLTLEADAAGMGALTYMRANTKRFIRVIATSPQLAGATTAYYGLTWDMCAVVSGVPGDLKDQDGVYAVEWTFKMVHDSTWGKAMNVALVNKTASL